MGGGNFPALRLDPVTGPSSRMKDLSEAEVVFFGDIAEVGMSGFQRMDTLRRLGATVRPVDLTLPRAERSLWGRLVTRTFGLPATPKTLAWVNRKTAALAGERAPDIAWFEWPRLVERRVLDRLRKAWPRTTFVCFQDDNPFGKRHQKALWKRFIANIPFYDVHFLKRESDLATFLEAGARQVRLFTSGYYEPVFDLPEPARPTQEVLFAGTAMDHRIEYLEELIVARSLPIHVRGQRWEDRSIIPRRRPDLVGPGLFGADCARLIRDHKISLGFVSSTNLDEYTMRSLEIPAAGGFLLAERTPFHQKLFREGVEAEFFSDVGECEAKIRHYLANEDARREIAENGARRCRQSGYGLECRMREAWTQLAELDQRF